MPFIFVCALALLARADKFTEVFDRKTAQFEKELSGAIVRSKGEAMAWAALLTAKATFPDNSSLDMASMKKSLHEKLERLLDEVSQRQDSKRSIITLKDLENIFKARKNGNLKNWLSEDELFELAAIILFQTERQIGKDSKKTDIELAQALIKRQIIALEKLAQSLEKILSPDRANKVISEIERAIKKARGLKKGNDKIVSMIKDLLRQTVDFTPIESLSDGFRPQHQQLFLGLSQKNRILLPPMSYNAALEALADARSERQKAFPITVPPQYSMPSPERGESAGHTPFNNGFFLPGSGSMADDEILAATGPELACLKDIRKNGYNVELQLPGALCGGSVVRPLSESCEPGTVARRFIRTARHCVYGSYLRGAEIGININPGGPMQFAHARVVGMNNPDGQHGEPLDNGNPDSAILEIEISCGYARQLRSLRPVTELEINKLVERGRFGVALGQNRSINATGEGNNRGVIFANTTIEPRHLFFRFNSSVSFDHGASANSEWGDDSNITRSGDSGSFIAACVKSGDTYEPVSLGSVSNVEIRQDRFAGKIGGGALAKNDAEFLRNVAGPTAIAMVEPRDDTAGSHRACAE